MQALSKHDSLTALTLQLYYSLKRIVLTTWTYREANGAHAIGKGTTASVTCSGKQIQLERVIQSKWQAENSVWPLQTVCNSEQKAEVPLEYSPGMSEKLTAGLLHHLTSHVQTHLPMVNRLGHQWSRYLHCKIAWSSRYLHCTSCWQAAITLLTMKCSLQWHLRLWCSWCCSWFPMNMCCTEKSSLTASRYYSW